MLSIVKAIQRIDIDPAWLLRIFTLIPAILILLAGAASIWIYFFVLSLLPQDQTHTEIPGLRAEVSVVRDRNGVPGIIGTNEEDVALVLGYVMAQDRLWQMDYFRRAGQGRLAEILGSEHLDADHLMRTVRCGIKANNSIDQLTEREKKWLDKFLSGINRYISGHENKLPVEFSLLEYNPSFFTVEDIESIIFALSWASSYAIRVDPALTRILTRLNDKRALELFPGDPAAPAPFVSNDLSGWKPAGLIFEKNACARSIFRVPGFRGGCTWAVGSQKSCSGSPLLGCTVFQALAAPGFWYRARLVIDGSCVNGAFIPGVPIALTGSNEKLSWGAALMPADDADLFLERFQDQASLNYRRLDGWQRCREFQETYAIKGGRAVSRSIILTHMGPLVSHIQEHRALSLKWTGYEGSGLFSAFFSINRAQTGKDVKDALKALVSPCLNVVWADREGNFGIKGAGRIPIRASDGDGIVPLPAWTGVHDWAGFIPYNELPSATNPDRGFCSTAQGRPGGAEYPLLVSCYWTDYGKNNRMDELLGQTGEHNHETFQKIATDNLSPLAKDLTPVLLQALETCSDKSGAELEAIKILSAWDFEMGRDSAAAAVFGLVYQALAEELLLKDLGEDLFGAFASHPAIISGTVRRIILEDRANWLAGAEPSSLLAAGFRKGIARGRNLLGNHPGKWKWGDFHQAEFRHPLTARSRFLEAIYDVGPFRLSGAEDTLNFSSWSSANPFGAIDGVSLREITDMTDQPAVYSANWLGISAHFFSLHYKDRTSAWAAGKFLPEPVLAADIRKGGTTSVLFTPPLRVGLLKN